MRKRDIKQFVNPGRAIISQDDFYERATKFSLLINNPNFKNETRKSDLVNLLLDLYYEKYFILIADDNKLNGDIKEIADYVNRQHKHYWVFVDKDNYVEKEGYIYRFICYSCHNYKRIDEDSLLKGIHTAVDDSESEQPISFAPPTHLSSVTSYKSSSNYG